MKILKIIIYLTSMLIIVQALFSTPAYSFDVGVYYTLPNGQMNSADKTGDDQWHIVTQSGWPDYISLSIDVKVNAEPDEYIDNPCDTVTISRENPPSQWQVKGSPNGANASKFTVTGIRTNRSLNPAFYLLKFHCYNVVTKHVYLPEITIRIDADALSEWDPGIIAGEAQGLIIQTPQEGATITGELILTLKATDKIPHRVSVEIQKAGVVDDTGVIGDISLPAGKELYGSQWERVFGESYSWPEGESTMYIRHGLAEPGLYKIRLYTFHIVKYSIAIDFGPIERVFSARGTQLKVKPAGSVNESPVVFGSKARTLTGAAVPVPQMGTTPEPPPKGGLSRQMPGTAPGGMAPATRGIGIKNKPAPVVAAPQGRMAPAMTGQPLTKAPAMKPLSGPPPTLQPPSLARAPAVAAPVPMTRQRVDTASQKAPVTAEQPGLKRQVVLARPEITYPAPNAAFTAPAIVTVKARLVSGKKYFYGLRQQGQTRDIGRNGNGQFANLNAGNYCVYVAYDPGGPSSDCVPFSVRLAMKKAPAMRTTPKPITQPAPSIAPEPMSPTPMKKTIPAPMTPGG